MKTKKKLSISIKKIYVPYYLCFAHSHVYAFFSIIHFYYICNYVFINKRKNSMLTLIMAYSIGWILFKNKGVPSMDSNIDTRFEFENENERTSCWAFHSFMKKGEKNKNISCMSSKKMEICLSVCVCSLL